MYSHHLSHNKGNKGDIMGVCEGDCDNNSECAGDLKCFQRSANEMVPGCVGVGVRGKDYCYNLNPGNPATVAPSASPFTKPTQTPNNKCEAMMLFLSQLHYFLFITYNKYFTF